MKSVKVYVKQKNGISYDVKFSFIKDFTKEQILIPKNIEAITNSVKKDIPQASFIEVLIPTTPKYSKEKLMKIGRESASLYGGECLSVSTYPNSVVFKCIENGDRFEEHYTYEELEKDYSQYLK